MNNCIKALDANWAPATDEERAADQAAYIKAHRERMARMHHREQTTDEELLERWEKAKEKIKNSISRRKKADRMRTALVQRVMAGAVMILLALGWLGLLAMLI